MASYATDSYRCRAVRGLCIFLCFRVLDTSVTCAKTGEPIEMPFGVRAGTEGLRNYALSRVHTGANWRIRWIELYNGGDTGC